MPRVRIHHCHGASFLPIRSTTSVRRVCSACAPLHLFLQHSLQCMYLAYDILCDGVFYDLITACKSHGVRLIGCAVAQRIDAEEILTNARKQWRTNTQGGNTRLK